MKKNIKKTLVMVIVILLLTISGTVAQESQSPQENLPSLYDLRNVDGKSYVTPVKNQRSFGTCWAFGNVATMESNLLKKGVQLTPDLSENTLAWYTFQMQGSKQMFEDEEEEGLFNLSFNLDWEYDTLSRIYTSGAHFETVFGQLST